MDTFEKTFQSIREGLLSEEDRRLLQLSFSSGISQEELDEFLDTWDIEAAPIQSVMLLAYLKKAHPELVFPEKINPRLQGVLTFCRFQNLKLSSHFHKIAEAFRKVGIPFLLLKGGAMKVYRPDFPRWMADMDVLVPEDRFREAVSAVKALGYETFKSAHSFDMRLPGTKENIVDIHRFLHMDTGKESLLNDDLFERARKMPMFSSEGLVPCPEDMVFISLVNFWNNVSFKTSAGSVVSTFFDIKYLVDSTPGFDWDRVRSDALKTGSADEACLSAIVLDSIVPGVLPYGFMALDGDLKRTERIVKRAGYNRDVLFPLREEIGDFNILAAIRERRNLWRYFCLRARFFFLKRLCP